VVDADQKRRLAQRPDFATEVAQLLGRFEIAGEQHDLPDQRMLQALAFLRGQLDACNVDHHRASMVPSYRSTVSAPRARPPGLRCRSPTRDPQPLALEKGREGAIGDSARPPTGLVDDFDGTPGHRKPHAEPDRLRDRFLAANRVARNAMPAAEMTATALVHGELARPSTREAKRSPRRASTAATRSISITSWPMPNITAAPARAPRRV